MEDQMVNGIFLDTFPLGTLLLTLLSLCGPETHRPHGLKGVALLLAAVTALGSDLRVQSDDDLCLLETLVYLQKAGLIEPGYSA